MSTTNQLSNNTFFLNKIINKYVKTETKNAIGIGLIYIMVSSGIASIAAALSVNGEVNVFILIVTACLAMSTNASVLSQQAFKTSTWLFISSIVINTLFIVYQVLLLI